MRHRVSRRGRRGLAAVGLLALVAVGCSGSEETTDPPVNNLAGSFQAETTSPGSDSVALAQEAASGNLVTLAVNVSDTADVYGAGFDLAYDTSHVQFVDWTAGDLLETGGHSPLYTVTTQPGLIVVGVSRNGAVAGVDVTGSATLIRLTFRVLSPGASDVAFSREFLVDSQPPAPTPIVGLEWFDGQFVAN